MSGSSLSSLSQSQLSEPIYSPARPINSRNMMSPNVPERKSSQKRFSQSGNSQLSLNNHQATGGKISQNSAFHVRRHSDNTLFTQQLQQHNQQQQQPHILPNQSPGSLSMASHSGPPPVGGGVGGLFSWQMSDSRLLGSSMGPYGPIYMNRGDAPSSSRSSLANSVIYEMLELDPEMFNITIQPEIDITRDLLTELKDIYVEKTHELVQAVLYSLASLSETKNNTTKLLLRKRQQQQQQNLWCEHSTQFTCSSANSTIRYSATPDVDTEESDDGILDGAEAFAANLSRDTTLKLSRGAVTTDHEQHLVDCEPVVPTSPGAANVINSQQSLPPDRSNHDTQSAFLDQKRVTSELDLDVVYTQVEAALSTESEQLVEQLKTMEASISELRAALERKEKELKDKSEKFQNERKTMSETCDRLGQENQLLKEENSRLNEEKRILHYEFNLMKSRCVCEFHGGSLQQIPIGIGDHNSWSMKGGGVGGLVPKPKLTPVLVPTPLVGNAYTNHNHHHPVSEDEETDDQESLGGSSGSSQLPRDATNSSTPVQSTKLLSSSSKFANNDNYSNPQEQQYGTNKSSQHSSDGRGSGETLNKNRRTTTTTGGRPGGRSGYGGVNSNRGVESDTDYEEVSKRPSYPNTDIDSTPNISAVSASGTSILGSAGFNQTASPYSSDSTSMASSKRNVQNPHTGRYGFPPPEDQQSNPQFVSQKSVSAEQIATFSPFPTNSLQHDKLSQIINNVGTKPKTRHSSAGPGTSAIHQGVFDPTMSPGGFSTIQTPRPGRASFAGSHFDSIPRTPAIDTRRHSISSSVYDLSLPDGSQPTAVERPLEKVKEFKMTKHIRQWPPEVLVEWMHLELGLGEQVRDNFTRNVKDVQTLLTLKSSELKSILGVTDKFERKRVQCAITFLANFNPDPKNRHPGLEDMRNLMQLDTDWMCEFLLQFVGLPEYKRDFQRNRVDGVLMNSLTVDDIEYVIQSEGKSSKTSKQCAVSIWYAWQLIRLLRYDEKTLKKRMVMCRNWDQDPLVWSNDRFFLYLKKHNFEAEAKNLNGLGIHGALLVLSKSFTIEKLFDKMKLNNSKQFVRARNNLYRKLTELLSGPRRQATERLELIQQQQNQSKDSSKSRSVPTLNNFGIKN